MKSHDNTSLQVPLDVSSVSRYSTLNAEHDGAAFPHYVLNLVQPSEECNTFHFNIRLPAQYRVAKNVILRPSS